MMGKISIFNYEIFYLDYLEGRLGEDDVRMLMAFFDEHPECKLDDPDLPVLNVSDDYVFQGKSDLKQTDDKEAITEENVEHFMISDSEGILSDEKQAELNQVVDGDAGLEKERKRYNAVYFAPDTSLVFQNKEDLKRRKTIVLWPYVSAGIAAAIISFIFLMNGDGSDFGKVEVSNPVAKTPEKIIPVQTDNESPSDDDQVIIEDAPIQYYNAFNDLSSYSEPKKKPLNNSYVPLKRKRPHSHLVALEKELMPITTYTNKTPNETPNVLETKQPEPYRTELPGDNRMVNPIEPVTSFISKKAKTEVDFGRKKATSEEKGGFYFKVGKFEISRNKH